MPLEFSPAEVARPVLAKMPLVIEFSGPLVAPRTAVVRAKAPGTLLSLSVGEGSRVKAGQPIGEIDLSDLQTRVSERSAMVESAQATLLEAERQHTANVGLASAELHLLDRAADLAGPARRRPRAAQVGAGAALDLAHRRARKRPARADLGHRRQAPRGPGREGERRAAGGDDRRPGSLELAGSVGTHEVSLLRPGQEVQVRVEGQRDSVAGKIDRIAPAAEAGTRAIGVVVTLDNKGERYRAGQYAQARVELADDAARLTVPTGAVGQASGQDFVWAIENGALVRRIVITGRKDPAAGRVEVSKGLTADTQILAARFDNLKEGAQAKVVPAARDGERLGGDAGERAGVVDAAVLRSGTPPCGSPASRSTTRSSPPW